MDEIKFNDLVKTKIDKKKATKGMIGKVVGINNKNSSIDKFGVYFDSDVGDCNTGNLSNMDYLSEYKNKSSNAGHLLYFNDDEVELTNNKPNKEEPKDYHLILKKSCMNFEKVCDSYKEAIKYLEQKKINDEYLIFKMTEVGLASPSIKIKKTLISKKKK